MTADRQVGDTNSCLRPRDAASLILVDQSGGRPKILMGRRAEGHVFMPGHLVFPGGRIDRSDRILARQFSISPAAGERLTARTSARFSTSSPVALALAAIRETFEEAGVMIGKVAAFHAETPFWCDFSKAGIRPTPQVLIPIARAVTPPGFPRRFDTRFFLTDVSAIAASRDFTDRPTDEFDAVAWIDVACLDDHRLAAITRLVLDFALTRLERGDEVDASRPMLFHRNVGRGWRTDFV